MPENAMLEKFRQAQTPRIQRLISLEDEGLMPAPFAGERPDFLRALWDNSPGAVIAEYKRASPSHGVINAALSPEEAARTFAGAGAAALSVLTEEAHFQGSLEFLDRMAPSGLPLLRKDFLLHPVQVIETAATKASALLLIARMCPREDLREMLGLAAAFELAAVVEVFDEADLEKAQALEPDIIQVNNRDLDTLSCGLEVAERLAKHKPDGQIWIAASGIAAPEDLTRMVQAGYDAVLVGASLMRHADPGAALRTLAGGAR